MTVNWYNPYSSTSGKWYKGNLHAHCIPESPCASISLETLISGYVSQGYDFLAVSDHLAVTLAQTPMLTMLPGIEWNSRSGLMSKGVQTQHDHVGIYGLDPEILEESLQYRTLADLFSRQDESSLLIANHPDWLLDEHYDFSTLLRFASNFDGMEIYNHSIVSDPGRADSTWKWDRLLSMGHPIIGFAHDDSHSPEDIGHAWLMVRAEDTQPETIFKSIKSGNFYCSTGVTILELERHGSRLYISVKDEATIRVIGSQGRVISKSVGTFFEWDFEGQDTEYARFHVRDSSWRQGWSQPFFVEQQ